MISLEVVTSLPQLLAIRDDWSLLHAHLPASTPFQSPDWLLTWWKHFGSGELRVFTFRNTAGELSGIIPCFLHDWMGKRQLTLLGSGVSDYLEPLIEQEGFKEIISEVRRELMNRCDWDVCSWQDLSAGSPLMALGVAEPDTPCSEILLTDNFEEFWAERSSGIRRNVKRYRLKAEQIASVEFAVSETFDEECFDALLRLHGIRWREQGESGMIDRNRSAEFLHEMSRMFAQKEMLHLFSLRFQSEIVAVILAFPFKNVIYAYLSAFDPAYSALGFGRILLHQALQYVSNHRFVTWNFLRGEEPYKADWGAQLVAKTRLLVTRDIAGT